MGVHSEINCEHGNGNQIFDRESWSWFDTQDQICEVVITRVNGGDLVFTLKGQGNDTPVTITKAVVDESNQNLYLGVIDATGSAYFHDIEPEEVENGDESGNLPDHNPETGDPMTLSFAVLVIALMSLAALLKKKYLSV